MTDFIPEVAGLSDEQRELLELLLQEQALDNPGAGIEQLLAALAAGESSSPLPHGRACPLSFSQRRLWFLDQVDPGSSRYNIPSAFRLTGSVDPDIFKACCKEIVHRQPSLRTTFPMVDGEPVQAIHDSMEIPIDFIDLQPLPPAQREAQALQMALEHAMQPFDLACGPLLRFALYRLDQDRSIGVLTMHHIISDGWSMGVFIKELITLYQVLSGGLPASASGLEPLTYQYTDYAAWQQHWMQSGELKSSLDYWKSKLGGELPILQIPGDHPRPAVSTGRGASLTFTLSAENLRAAKKLAGDEGATLFMVLLAAYFALLHRSCGQDDICIGTPIANRTRAEVEALIGFFVNTLVFRLKVDEADTTFSQLVRQVRDVAWEAYAHQDLPFDVLVDALHPERDTSYAPLFQTMFVLQNTPLQAIRLPGLTVEQIELHTGGAKFDLTLSLAEENGLLTGVLEYSRDLFDETGMRRWIGHLQTLFDSALAKPDQALADLPLLTPLEWQEIVVGWNQTAAPYPNDLCMHQAFQAAAQRNPSVVAVVVQEKCLTYAELDRRSNQVAHWLKHSGVGPDVPVAIFMERSPELIIAILGVLKAGGAYVPLDPLHPPQRQTFMMDEIVQACSSAGAAPVLVTHSALRHALPAPDSVPQSLLTLYVDSDTQLFGQPEYPVETQATSRHLAYILYTSGSTGTPKGVCVQHQGVINLLADFGRRAPLSVSDHSSWWTSLNFDVSVYEIFSPLLVGATLYIVPDEIRPESRKYFDWMHANQIHSAYIPPFMIAEYKEWLAREDWIAVASGPARPCLRRLLVGVEPIHEQLLAEINRHLPELHILNGYGPTEATICCTLFPVQPDQAQNRNAPIGRPTANTQIYVLDDHMQPVPVGVAGELYVGGDGLARGYLNRPDLTAERFIPNPFSPALSPRLYKTGDMVRYLADGNIEFIGRADFQVKLHGFRIELGEIEAALSQHPGVRKSVVLLWEPVQEGTGAPPASKDRRLVAYVVSPPDAELTAAGLRRFLKDRLPDYMLPTAFVVLGSLPITPNGKVDRRALPPPDFSQALQDREHLIGPRNPVEQQLLEIWSDLLGIATISIEDNFFELGGHSLLATQMNTRIREQFHIELSLRDFFGEPTIEFLAQQIADGENAPAPRIPPHPGGNESAPRRAQLSFSQQRMWMLHQLDPQDAAYNIPLAVRLQGDLDSDALYGCIDSLVARHAALRTTFGAEDGIPFQLIAPVSEGLSHKLVIFEDLSFLAGSGQSEALQAVLVREATRPFDLQTGPLLRCVLLRLSPDENILLLVMHHIVSDGWSMGLLLEEISALYRAEGSGVDAQLPAISIQYADYAEWQREYLSGDSLKRLQDYWVEKLSGLPASLDLPYDRPRPPVQTARGAHLALRLDDDMLAGLKDLGRQAKTTLFITLLAAFQSLLYRYSGQADICVGTPVANRGQNEVENLVGCFINTLVLHGGFTTQSSFWEILTQVRNSALEAYAHQDFPFEKLVDALQPERDMGRTPLFQVMFILQNAPVRAITLPGLTLQPLEIETGISTFDLTLALAEDQSGLSGGFEYNTDLFDAPTIRRMASHFETMLRGILANPDQSVASLPLMSVEEYRQVLELSRGPRVNYPAGVCMHQLFEVQAARTPNQTAAVMPEVVAAGVQALTYRELNARANRLAHFLQGLGVKPGSPPVGLFVQRSFEMLTGMLGILKAGGAYLPLDPAYPAERLEFILRDAQVDLVLTQSRLKPQLPPGNYQVICLDSDWEQIVPMPDTQPECRVSASDLAYVIYTSGSTGQPKGVMVPHRAVVNHNLNAVDYFRLTPRDRVLQFMSISFDAAIEEIFPTWAAGATLILRPGDDLPTGERLCALVESQALTVLDLPTAYWHEWVYELALSGAALPSCLRLVVIGGEKASSERLAAWQKVVGGSGITLLNTYGPTEGTIIDTVYKLPSNSLPWEAGQAVPIGRPIANVDAYILDAGLQPVPPGVAGELHIGGAAVAAGYLNRPDLTRQRFIPDPFNLTDQDARLYKTGDRVRLLPDGNIQFLGRHDQQVKIRGYRVEPGEIEAQIEQFPGIRQAAVIAWDGGGAAKQPGRTAAHLRLVAWIVWDLQPPDLDGLRQFLRSRLPDYMLPAHYVELDNLPYTASGKIDRKQLDDRLGAGHAHELLDRPGEPAGMGVDPAAAGLQVGDTAQPETAIETRLAEIWQQVLGLEQVQGQQAIGPHQNFFELGGDSILAIQVIARAAQAGMQFTPRQFFENPTLAGLAAVAKLLPAAMVKEEEELYTGPVPLTPIQQWFFDQELPAPHHWNQALLLEAVQPLERHLLQAAAAVLLERHPALRLRFRQSEDGRQAEMHETSGENPVVWIDLSQDTARQDPLTASTFGAELSIQAQAESLQASLDLANGPLFRLACLDLGPGLNQRLMIVAHHLVMDGISWRILLDDLQTAYTCLSQGMDARQCMQTMPAGTSSYARWALRLADYAHSPAIDDERAYWATFSRRLAGSPSSIWIPTDFQGGPNDIASADDVNIALSEAETDVLLHATPAAYHTDPQDIMLTALVQAFNRWSGIPQLYLELEGHGREDLLDDIDVSRTIGWFTTIHPVLLDLRGQSWPGRALVAVKEALRQVPHRGFGLGLLRSRRDLAPGSLPERMPQVSFNYLGQFDATLKAQQLFRLAPESRGPDRGLNNPRGYIFEVSAGVIDGCLQVHWSYSRNLHCTSTVETLAEHMLTAMREIIRHCTSGETGSYSPSDFQLAGLDQHRLDKLLSRMGNQEGK